MINLGGWGVVKHLKQQSDNTIIFLNSNAIFGIHMPAVQNAYRKHRNTKYFSNFITKPDKCPLFSQQ